MVSLRGCNGLCVAWRRMLLSVPSGLYPDILEWSITASFLLECSNAAQISYSVLPNPCSPAKMNRDSLAQSDYSVQLRL